MRRPTSQNGLFGSQRILHIRHTTPHPACHHHRTEPKNIGYLVKTNSERTRTNTQKISAQHHPSFIRSLLLCISLYFTYTCRDKKDRLHRIFEIFPQAQLQFYFFTNQQQIHAVSTKTRVRGTYILHRRRRLEYKKKNRDERGQSGRSGKLRWQADAKLLSCKPLAYLCTGGDAPKFYRVFFLLVINAHNKMLDRNEKRASSFVFVQIGTRLFGIVH